jgi:hypothetical protein
MARPGETHEQISKRYDAAGSRLRMTKNEVVTEQRFAKRGTRINVTFVKDVSVRETFEVSSENEATEILQSISENKQWKRTSVIGQALRWKWANLKAALDGDALTVELSDAAQQIAAAAKLPKPATPSKGF